MTTERGDDHASSFADSGRHTGRAGPGRAAGPHPVDGRLCTTDEQAITDDRRLAGRQLYCVSIRGLAALFKNNDTHVD